MPWWGWVIVGFIVLVILSPRDDDGGYDNPADFT